MPLIIHKKPDLAKEKQFFDDHDLMLSAYKAQAIASNGKGLDTYTTELVQQHYDGFQADKYTNEDIDRGNEFEPHARAYYEKINNVSVQTSPFIKCGEHWGVTPDGLVESEGLAEIKIVNDRKFEDIKNGLEKPESKYLWQTQMQLLGTKRKWNDLFYYNRQIIDGTIVEDYVVFRQYPDNDKFVKLEEGIRAGTELIKRKLSTTKL